MGYIAPNARWWRLCQRHVWRSGYRRGRVVCLTGIRSGNAHFHLTAEHRHYYDTDAGDDYPPDDNAA